ncbi:unnamed protein product [Didymodactylos carnosus]|uniref:tRNA (34-2'-O)-methyltransferase regulator WDR6 n=1 Tax=Didymodactylos carnosus TaxID=1234261 RepID=A0A815DJH6_9BILA|nr:unnamed protein product [Didymodactylos carnosus]CAF1297286.1 unnamed protein product [Didymodactylos carnosus]CAF3746383.1 unnamed protein product [Didymodactylos carnosus]CAF4114291.1 unnamed protein product [Didymodactylos carnosus]
MASGTVFGQLIIYELYNNECDQVFEELLRLSDHNGAIFGISYNNENHSLCTVGDDRTVKVYKFDKQLTLDPVCSFFGHEARIWKSCLTQSTIITAGEDSSIRVWSYNGQMLHRYVNYRCKNVWSIDIVNCNSIVSGWSDGGLRLYHLDTNSLDSHHSLLEINDDFPRNVCFISSSSIICHMDSGKLMRLNLDGEIEKNELFYDGTNNLKSYATMMISPYYKQLAIGTLSGLVLLFNLEKYIAGGENVRQFQADTNKIFQVLWPKIIVNGENYIREEPLLVCLTNGLMSLYDVAGIPTILQRFQLPKGRQSWPNTCLWLKQENLFIVGDRQGNIACYTLNNTDDVLSYSQLFRELHGKNGVSSIDLFYDDRLICSCGKDGIYNLFEVCEEPSSLTLKSSSTLSTSIGWLNSLLVTSSARGTQHLFTCYQSSKFCLYSLEQKRSFMEVECGGGHRSSDFYLHDMVVGKLVYIRNKNVYIATKNLKNSLNDICLTTPTHGTEIRCVKLFKPEILHSIVTLQRHLSAVCDISVIESSSLSSYFLFSCGARAQICAWKVTSQAKLINVTNVGDFMLHPLKRTKKKSLINGEQPMNDTELDVRFTSITVMPVHQEKNGESFLVFVSSSDSFLRVLHYLPSLKRFILLHCYSYTNHCLLSLTSYIPKNYIFTAATDGSVCVYDFTVLVDNVELVRDNNIRYSSITVHQSGVNDIDVRQCENDLLLVSTVGDDGSVFLLRLDNDLSWSIVTSFLFAHQSPATVRFLSDSVFVSIGIDQRLKFWNMDVHHCQIDNYRTTLVDITDILSMDVLHVKK